MRLTNEEIAEILEKVPETKSEKLALLAVFMQVAGEKLGLNFSGDLVADIMQWSSDAHIEECDTCSRFKEALREMGDR